MTDTMTLNEGTIIPFKNEPVKKYLHVTNVPVISVYDMEMHILPDTVQIDVRDQDMVQYLKALCVLNGRVFNETMPVYKVVMKSESLCTDDLAFKSGIVIGPHGETLLIRQPSSYYIPKEIVDQFICEGMSFLLRIPINTIDYHFSTYNCTIETKTSVKMINR